MRAFNRFTPKRLLLLLCAVGACGRPAGPDMPDGAVPLTPPSYYRTWWQVVESCSGHRGDFHGVSWWYVPGVERFAVGERRTDGVWYSSGNRIVLAEAAISRGDVVRHEVLHALIRRPGHPVDQFQGRCEGVVACSATCELDGGGVLDRTQGAQEVSISALLLGATLTPARSTITADSGLVTVLVSVKNPRTSAVWVPLPRKGGGTRSKAFGTVVRDPSGATLHAGEQLIEYDQFFLRGSEQRQFAFDVTLAAGQYIIQPRFGNDSAAAVLHEVLP